MAHWVKEGELSQLVDFSSGLPGRTGRVVRASAGGPAERRNDHAGAGDARWNQDQSGRQQSFAASGTDVTAAFGGGSGASTADGRSGTGTQPADHRPPAGGARAGGEGKSATHGASPGRVGQGARRARSRHPRRGMPGERNRTGSTQDETQRRRFLPQLQPAT